MRGTWLIAGLALVIGVGCNEKPPEDWVNLDVAPGEIPHGWVRTEDLSAGYSIDLPADWLTEGGDPKDSKAVAARAKKVFPAAGAHSLSQGNAHEFDLLFTDFDPAHVKLGVLQSGSVKVEPAKSEYKSKVVAASANLPTMQEKETLAWPGVAATGPYMRLQYDALLPNHAGGAELPGKTRLYYFGRENIYWVLTFTYADANSSSTESTIEKIIESIRFKKPNIDAVRAAREKRKRDAEATLGIGG